MKKILTIVLLLVIGIFAGFGIGFLSGIFFEQEQTIETPQTITATPLPIGTVTPMPALSPVPTNTPVPTVSLTPTNTPVPTVSLTPTNTPVPTVSLTPTNTPTPTPSPTPTNTPTPTPSPTPSPTPLPVWTEDPDGFYGALRVEGTNLMGEDGCLVQLRGISTHGLGWFPEYVNETMIAQIRQEWGCNVFRLAMYTAENNGYCTSGSEQKENLKKIIDTGVKAAVAQEMYVIIDWHILSDGNPAIYKEEAKTFFAEMAKKYGNLPNVIYEICNEPNGRGDWATIKEYALEIIPVIRNYAPNAIIVVGTPTWSQDVDVAAKDPITEYDNIMYALHFYAGTHTDSLRDKCKTAVKKGLPLFVTEYGICDASGNGNVDMRQADKWMDFLDSYGISHVMWNLSNKEESCAVIQSNCKKTENLTTNDLSIAGLWFINMLANAGAGNETWIKPEVKPTATPTPSVAPPTGEADTGDSVVDALFDLPENIGLTVSGNWPVEGGQAYQLDVVIKNNGSKEENSWVRQIRLKDGQTVTISQCWCAKISQEGNVLTLTPEDYNKTVPAGGKVTGIGIIIEVR